MSRFIDLLYLAEGLIDPNAPPLKILNPGLMPAWHSPAFPHIPPMKNRSLSDILLGHGETKESD